MLRFEALTLAYFVALSILAPFTRAPRRRVVAFVLRSGGLCLFVILASAAASPDVRAWLAHVYLVAAYWLPAFLVSYEAERLRFEAWLVRTDAVWRRYAVPLPGWTGTLLELAYLLCYPAVPLAFVAVWLHGGPDDIDRFWVAVLASGYLSYGWLPWLVSRPPRVVEAARRADVLAGVNIAVLGRMSHQLNTFPSGHVAVSLAAALSVLPVWMPGGAVLAAVALGVAIGAVAGRYHYFIDVLLGIAVGVGCTVLAAI